MPIFSECFQSSTKIAGLSLADATREIAKVEKV
jgi:hypothetical protein